MKYYVVTSLLLLAVLQLSYCYEKKKNHIRIKKNNKRGIVSSVYPIHGHGLSNSNLGHAIVYNNQIPIVVGHGDSKDFKSHMTPVYLIGAMSLGTPDKVLHGSSGHISKPLIKHKGGQKQFIHNVGQIIPPVIHKSVPSKLVQTIIVPNNGLHRLNQETHGTSSSFGHSIVHMDQALQSQNLKSLKVQSSPQSYTVGHSIKVSETPNLLHSHVPIHNAGHAIKIIESPNIMPAHLGSPSHSFSTSPQVSETIHNSAPVSYSFTVNKPTHEVPVSIEVPPHMIHQQSTQPVTIIKPASIVLNKLSYPHHMKYTMAHPTNVNHVPMVVSHSSPSPVIVPHQVIIGNINEESKPVHEDFGNGAQSYSYYTSVSRSH